MPKFPENKNYKQSPYPMVEGTSIHKEALQKASPATFAAAVGSAQGAMGNVPKPHTHTEDTEGVKYQERKKGGVIGGFLGGDVSNSGEEGLEEDHVYESSRGTENA